MRGSATSAQGGPGQLGAFVCSHAVLVSPGRSTAGVSRAGRLSPLKALGTRLSLADRGLTFGTALDGGVCIRFRHPVRGIEPFGLIRHPGLTVTVTDPDRLIGVLTNLVAVHAD